MDNAIRGLDVIERLLALDLIDQLVDALAITVGQKDGPRIGHEGLDVPSPVVLFVLARLLMLQYPVLVIGINMTA